MMKAIQRIASVLCMFAMLASVSFAASSCTLCAPHSEKNPAASAKKSSAHDHCGPVHNDKQEFSSMAASHCEHFGAACIAATKNQPPAVQTVSSAELVAPAVSQVSNEVGPAKNLFSPPREAFDPRSTLALLAGNLRV